MLLVRTNGCWICSNLEHSFLTLEKHQSMLIDAQPSKKKSSLVELYHIYYLLIINFKLISMLLKYLYRHLLLHYDFYFIQTKEKKIDRDHYWCLVKVIEDLKISLMIFCFNNFKLPNKFLKIWHLYWIF